MGSKWIRPVAALLALALIVVVVVIASSSSSSDNGESKGPSAADLPTTSSSSNIYVLDLRTRHVRELTRNDLEQIAQGPAWSDQGSIVFSQAFSDESFAYLYLLNPNRPPKK